MPDLSEAIEKLLAHPELLSTVASVLGKPPPAPMESQEQPQEKPYDAASAPSPPMPEAISALAPLLSGLSKGGALLSPRKDDPRVCLLRALKPYLSAERCEAIDTMIRLSPIAELLQKRNQERGGGL